MVDVNRIARITSIKDRVTEYFDSGDWETLALYLGKDGRIISNHPRLLRSLGWGDPDYPACVAEVIGQLCKNDPEVLDLLEGMLKEKGNTSPSNQVADSMLFDSEVRDCQVNTSQAAAMMPFKPSFQDVRATISKACDANGLTLKAADEIWEHSVLIQDIFDLIKTSCIVIVDFTDKNPNVMYETGIAHALGKEVIPITQSMEDFPFDLQHHRILVYDNNEEGRRVLLQKLKERIKTILHKHHWQPLAF